ncbi:uncharacterized protein DUF4126 [Murinocardiopsis flavida]|uniref:Uncharacterized protein DUF4126 n=1 Tax=Murinocardiopsis flavida TaxID=645275 RepID=A0A2P8DGT7_9ACTN|nr:DUF4126 domain-containing protein [Murinocardiopsis flavida]PSK96418.1 uncharacterized protein DUF4126 [Murinocardiopsis flavida]
MLELLTGAGLASAAGLNAYVPLLLVGLVARFTGLLDLSPAWQWLEHPVFLVVLAVLLVVEMGADKVPGLDSANDIVQTLIRPTSGGITFGAGASSLAPDEVASLADGSGSWAPVFAGVCIALLLHIAKALARPVLNALTFGTGAPVVSTLEDISSTVVAVLAIVVPILIIVVVPLIVVLLVWAIRRRRRRKAAKAAGAAGAARPGGGASA